MRWAAILAVLVATGAVAQPAPVDKKAHKIDPPIRSTVPKPPPASGTRPEPPAPSPKPPKVKHAT